MNRRALVLSAVATAVFAAASPALAGDLSPKAAGEILDAIDGGLATYFDTAVGARARKVLKANRTRYLALGDREALAAAVTADLLATTSDKHLKLSVATNSASTARLSEEDEEKLEAHLAHGLTTIRRLPGNIGFLKLRYFAWDEAGAAMVDQALGLLKDCDALIIDLRDNTGGGGATDARLLGQLSREPLPMTVITYLNEDGTRETVQRAPSVPAGGPLFPDQPLYVLTSAVTFSAAEEFVYDLKAARRAVVVGERTRGGANPANRPVPLPYGMRIFIPNGHAVHPTTGTNWEGLGVAPDVETLAEGALTEAYRRALERVTPRVATPKSEAEIAAARADPAKALDESL